MLQTAFGTHRRASIIAAVLLTLAWLAVCASTVSPSVNFIDSGELITALNEPGIAHPPGYPLYTLMGYVVSNLLPGEIAWRVNIISAFWGALAVGTFFLLIILLTNYLAWTATLKAQKDTIKYRGGKQVATASPRRRAATQGHKALSAPPPTERLFLGLSASEWLALAGAAAVASLLGASSTFWSRTAQAKMYTLHYFFVALLYLFALLARWAYELKAERALKWSLLALNITLGLSLANHLMTVLLVPGLLLMLLAGSDPLRRLKALAARWMYGVPALLLPVLLYLYLPLRSSQRP